MMRRLAREERGTTLIELMVGLSTGLVVMAGLTILVIVTLHTQARVSARTDATQRGRTVMTRIVDQLHSACIAPKVAPIHEGSTPTTLKFVHASGGAAVPVPVLSEIRLSGTTLTQTDYAYTSGNPPAWSFDLAKPATRSLMTHVSQISSTQPVFTYYESANGGVSSAPLTALPTLGSTNASRTIFVKVAFKAAPTGGLNTEAATPAHFQGGATLRLTTPSFNKLAQGIPCQ